MKKIQINFGDKYGLLKIIREVDPISSQNRNSGWPLARALQELSLTK